MVKYLIKEGANINYINNFKETALTQACDIENEKIINVLEESITNYLVKLSKKEISDTEAGVIASSFHVINDIERIGDHDENIADLAAQRNEQNISYSSEAIEDLYEIYNYTIFHHEHINFLLYIKYLINYINHFHQY